MNTLTLQATFCGLLHGLGKLAFRADKTAADLLAALPEYAMFTLPHPDGTMHTFQGYLGGDTTVTMMSYWDMGQGCESRWKNLKATVIER